MSADHVNGAFELFGALMTWRNVTVLWRHKEVRGVSLLPSAFFTSWGFWNLYYYPALDQWASFAGGLAIVAANVAWLALALFFQRRNRL